MKRLALLLGLLVLSIPMAGCGDSSSGVPADGSNLPPEVKEAEDKMQKDIADRQAGLAKPGSPARSGQNSASSAARPDPNIR